MSNLLTNLNYQIFYFFTFLWIDLLVNQYKTLKFLYSEEN